MTTANDLEAAGVEFIDQNGGPGGAPTRVSERVIAQRRNRHRVPRADLASESLGEGMLGIELIDENGGGSGVRLRKGARQEQK